MCFNATQDTETDKTGETTGELSEVDKAWTWRTKEVNLWTGYQNEGRIFIFKSISINKGFTSGWKFTVFSQEISFR
jgi:hypothetical protein